MSRDNVWIQGSIRARKYVLTMPGGANPAVAATIQGTPTVTVYDSSGAVAYTHAIDAGFDTGPASSLTGEATIDTTALLGQFSGVFSVAYWRSDMAALNTVKIPFDLGIILPPSG